MSPTDAGRFSSAVTLANLKEALSTPAYDEDTSKLEDEAGEATLATDPWSPRPVSQARVGLSQNAHPRAYNDPSNYLG
jgi:hypothetical protein